MGLKYGGKVKDNYLAMRGPCQEGFHVPTKNELSDLLNIMKNRGLGDVANFTRYLKMPNRGCRGYDDGSVRYQGGPISLYWSCTSNMYGGNPSSPSSANSLLCGSDEVKTMSHNISYGFFIRQFKNEIVIPDSNRTVLYQGTGNSGIFHNNSLGLISISDDGINRKTISDKNLGATTVRNYGDAGTDANCGYFYQWGNNYGFPFSGNVTTGTTPVDITQYGPGNYYSSSTFILASSVSHGWNSTINKNLRGGQARLPFDIKERQYGGKRKNKYTSMRGPCDEGFHIMLRSERVDIFNRLGTLGLDTGYHRGGWNYPLKMPMTGSWSPSDGGYYNQAGNYWHSDAPSVNGVYSPSYSYGVFTSSATTIAQGKSIRPIKDIPVIPDSTWTMTYDGSSIATGAGIFWSSTLGLISISSDGINRVTIADKNIGATEVRNQGDSLTSAKCGYCFQRGNCYGRPYGTTVENTTQDKTDVTGYGPGNYYYSSTIYQGGNDSRYIDINRDLRGGQTGIQKVPVKVKKVYYGGKLVDNYSAMRGPCPEGFHVPSKEEWDSVISIGTTLSAWSNTSQCETILNLTNHKYLNSTNGTYVASLNGAIVWTSSYYSSSLNVFSTTASTIKTGSFSGNRNHAFQIRPFKDISIKPDNSWTTLVDGSSVANGAGIFSNSSLGLISLSSDGITWITMDIKNLGAPDTTTEGYYYQRGNNNGFVANGYTTSSTQVDVNGYGPGNYYSSNIFITQNPRWTAANKNLRGGETGIQQRPILIREDNS